MQFNVKIVYRNLPYRREIYDLISQSSRDLVSGKNIFRVLVCKNLSAQDSSAEVTYHTIQVTAMLTNFPKGTAA